MEIRRNVLAVLNHFAQPYLIKDAPQTYHHLGKSLRHMNRRWLSGMDVDYSSDLTRFAFLCSHVPVNADSLAWIMQSKCYAITRFMVRKLTEVGVLRVWAFGGGPGTEMFAIHHQLERAQDLLPEVLPNIEAPRVEFTACDREFCWTLIFDKMCDRLSIVNQEMAAPKKFRFSPVPKLLVSPQSLLPPGDPPDLYLFNYVLSENSGNLKQVIGPIVDAAPEDALFVLTDVSRPIKKPTSRGKEFLMSLGLKIEWPRQQVGAVDEKFQKGMFMIENVELMNPFYDGIKQNFHGWELRRNSDVFWLVASKQTPHPEFPVD